MSRHKHRRPSSHGRRPHAHGGKAGNLPRGKIEVMRRGFGFVETEEGTFYIPYNRMNGAMNGDYVEVRPSSHPQDGSHRRASVVRVHERANEYIVGRLDITPPIAAVVSLDPRMQHDIFVDARTCPEAQAGDIVLARIVEYPSRHTPASGYIVERLGQADAPGMDVDVIVHAAGLPTEFSHQALVQAEGIEADIEGALKERGRRDLRERNVFTIDPTDAKDFDDAISLDHVEGLTRLGVHIADVSSYVPWDSSIDICARDRATSVYLVDRVIPMLPERLSNNICSLKPGKDRRAMSVDLFLDEEAHVVRYEIFPSVICSHRRFNYDEVQEILDGKREDPYRQTLLEFHRIGQKLEAIRTRHGALDFDSVEAHPVLDETGHPINIVLREKNDATSMIEQAMILANETVANHVFGKSQPLVYRVHDAPRRKALEGLIPVLKRLGYPIKGLRGGEPEAYQRVLNAAKGKPNEELVNYLVLRSMERAKYITDPRGHFGLALDHYCHFTSPIRRYPDLMVHRLLKDPRAMEGQLDWLAAHSSTMERQAEDAERESVEVKLAEYLLDHRDEEFEGTISTVMMNGFFVRLDNTAEGMILFDRVHDEVHSFDASMQTLMGEETGRTYKLGQRVRVRVKDVDIRTHEISFELA